MRALALFSGGLDSMLAIKLITSQDIEVLAIHMNIGFGGTKDLSKTFKTRANAAGAKFLSVDIRQKYINEILFSPKYGYGKRFNPCIDCHAFMFKTAKDMLKEFDANFIVTGEVLGQRPMSQNGKSLKTVLELSGDHEDTIILRPMSAKLLSPTIPEINGWVDREKLLAIQGRDRKIQLELAKKFGFEEFQAPGGGCLLTELSFTQKLKDFVTYKMLEVEDIDLLKIGRHFRLPDGAKLILGRNEEENLALLSIKNNNFEDVKVDENIPAPFGKISKNASKNDKFLACKITLSYTKADKQKAYFINIGNENINTYSFDNREFSKKYAIGI